MKNSGKYYLKHKNLFVWFAKNENISFTPNLTIAGEFTEVEADKIINRFDLELEKLG